MSLCLVSLVQYLATVVVGISCLVMINDSLAITRGARSDLTREGERAPAAEGGVLIESWSEE